MKSMLMAIMAVAVAVTFSAPAFAGDTDTKKPTKDEKKGGHVVVFGEEGKKPAEEKKKGGYTDTFGEEGKKEEKKPTPGK
jgi:hypothetical protein